MKKTTAPLLANTISVEQAIAETKNWRQILTPFMGENVLRGFYIPISDIVNLGNFHHVEGVRGYLCLTDPGDFSSIKFILVPVGDDGKDILRMPGDAGDDDSTIYDFTRPCPAFCDQDSPLY